MRSRADYEKLVHELLPGAIDAKGYDPSPPYVYVSYLFDNEKVLSEVEKNNLLSELDKYRPFGIPLPEIKDPERLNSSFNILVKVYPSTDTAQVTSQIESALDVCCKKLGATVDTYELEARIEEASFVKTARVKWNIIGEEVGTGDGATTQFALRFKPVVEGSEKIYLDGVQTSDYTIDYSTGTITFSSPPEEGVVITADYAFEGKTSLNWNEYIVKSYAYTVEVES